MKTRLRVGLLILATLSVISGHFATMDPSPRTTLIPSYVWSDVDAETIGDSRLVWSLAEALPPPVRPSIPSGDSLPAFASLALEDSGTFAHSEGLHREASIDTPSNDAQPSAAPVPPKAPLFAPFTIQQREGTASAGLGDANSLVIGQTEGSTFVVESGRTDSYWLKLAAPPQGGDAIIIAAPDAQVALSNSLGGTNPDGSVSLVFTPLNYAVPQSIRVLAIDDPRDESLDAGPDHVGVVTHTVRTQLSETQSRLQVAVRDNDAARLVIADTTFAEGDAGPNVLGLSLELTSPSDVALTTTVTTGAVEDSAAEGIDYASLDSSQVTFEPGQSSQTLSVTIHGDTQPEAAERFTIFASAPQGLDAGLRDGDAVITIVNDDRGAPQIVVSAPDGSTKVVESGAGDTYTVHLAEPPLTELAVLAIADPQLRITDRQGRSNPDGSVALVFTPVTYNSPQMIRVTAVDDDTDESLDLGAPHGALIRHLSQSLTDTLETPLFVEIVDDDAPFLAVYDDAHAKEGASAVPMTFTVTMSQPSRYSVTVEISTESGTATEGVDFGSLDGTVLTFEPDEVSKVIVVDALPDAEIEEDESFVLFLANASGGDVRIQIGDATGTILAD